MDKGGRKPRFGFNVKKDILLLKTALHQNPWQLGEDKWSAIKDVLNQKYKANVVIRTMKNRIQLLLDKFNAQELSNSTGTEEERTERGSLLEEINIIVEEEKAKINRNIGADDILVLTDEDDDMGHRPNKKKERINADKEREELLNCEAPSPIKSRKKRKISLEDELIQKRQDHEMAMDKERLELERDKVQLEEKREDRLKEEGRRRDEIAASQLQFQSQLLEMLAKFTDKS